MFDFITPATIWLLLGIVLAIMEMVIPGLIIIFFAVGAILTTLTTMTGLTTSFTAQMILFLISSLLFLVLFHKVWKKKKGLVEESETTNLNLELGKIVPVVQFINPEEGGGKVRYQGTLWSATSKNKIPPGESVRVIGCDNLTLLVETIDK